MGTPSERASRSTSGLLLYMSFLFTEISLCDEPPPKCYILYTYSTLHGREYCEDGRSHISRNHLRVSEYAVRMNISTRFQYVLITSAACKIVDTSSHPKSRWGRMAKPKARYPDTRFTVDAVFYRAVLCVP